MPHALRSRYVEQCHLFYQLLWKWLTDLLTTGHLRCDCSLWYAFVEEGQRLRFDVSCSYESRILRLPQGEQTLSVAAVGMRSRFHRDGYIFVLDVKNAVLSVVGPYLICPALAFTNGGYLVYTIQSSCLVLSH